MIDNTLTVEVGIDSFELIKINEGNYSSEFLVKGPLSSLRMKIRHSKEKPSPDGIAYDRHNVELTQFTYPTEIDPKGTTAQAYMVVRANPNNDGFDAKQVARALSAFLANETPDVLSQVINWES
ncbi:MAG: putative coat protein [Suhnsivirus montiscola]|uniref:Coat protein n=1 Tax=Leviviridae sp. TaxID=2027243 RepID=A0ABY3SUH9_9VIRU|nr:MAG: putative coat protein [Leviviridae sp.]